MATKLLYRSLLQKLSCKSIIVDLEAWNGLQTLRTLFIFKLIIAFTKDKRFTPCSQHLDILYASKNLKISRNERSNYRVHWYLGNTRCTKKSYWKKVLPEYQCTWFNTKMIKSSNRCGKWYQKIHVASFVELASKIFIQFLIKNSVTWCTFHILLQKYEKVIWANNLATLYVETTRFIQNNLIWKWLRTVVLLISNKHYMLRYSSFFVRF